MCTADNSYRRYTKPNQQQQQHQQQSPMLMMMPATTTTTTTTPTTTPGPKDILCGRGNVFSTHEGNKYFQTVVRSNLRRYREAPDRSSKIRVVEGILRDLRSEGVRFVVKTIDNNQNQTEQQCWHELPDVRAHKKIGHAIRDTLRSGGLLRCGERTSTATTTTKPAGKTATTRTTSSSKPSKWKRKLLPKRRPFVVVPPPPPPPTTTTEIRSSMLPTNNSTTTIVEFPSFDEFFRDNCKPSSSPPTTTVVSSMMTTATVHNDRDVILPPPPVRFARNTSIGPLPAPEEGFEFSARSFFGDNHNNIRIAAVSQ